MATKKQPVRRPDNPYQSSADGADLSPANVIAFELLSERKDLFPSVERIMNAGVSEEVAVEALTLFRNALVDPGSPHRHPQAALDAAVAAASA